MLVTARYHPVSTSHRTEAIMAKRRANGRGGVTGPLPNRKSPYRVRFPRPDGGGYLVSFHRTDAEAQRALRQLERDAESGTPIAEGRQTVEHWLREWLDGKRPPQREYNTWSSYDVDIRLHILPVIGRVPLGKLTPQHVQRVVARALADDLSSNTAHGVYSTLRNALGDAYRLGLIGHNPCDRVSAPSVRRGETQVYDAAQVQQLRETVRGDRLEALYVLALSTGMRRGELLGLRWRDVDLACGVVTVNMQMQREPRAHQADGQSRTELRSKDTKTAGSRRQIPIADDVVTVLREHRRRQVTERLAAGEAWQDRDLVIATPRGTPLTVSAFQRHYARTLARAGLPYIRPHDIRHTTATLLLSSGQMQANEVAAILGHASVNLVLSLYGHVMPGRKRIAADVMGRILGGTNRETTEREREGRS